MESIFGFYYVIKMLETMGWPRRRSLFNSEAVFDSTILDASIGNMIDWASSLGALRPELALKILSTVYRSNDWDSKDSYSLVTSVDNLKNTWKENGNNPRLIVNPVKFSKHSKQVSMKQLKDPEIKNALEVYFTESLIWGLCNPELFKQYFHESNQKHEQNMPKYKMAGLGINKMPTIDELMAEGEEMLKVYEKDIRPLTPIASKLKDESNSLGLTL